jgi:hypothetical protein
MHPAVSRLANYGEEFSAQDAADILGMHRTALVRIIKKPNTLLEAREHNSGNGSNPRYFITREALLRYLVKSTTGDKTVLFAAIREKFPRSLALLEEQALPPNAIPIFGHTAAKPRKPAAGTDRLANHPDLFLPAAQA